MLAMDPEEANHICEKFLKGKSLDELYDVVIVPALSLAEADRHRGKLDEEKQQYIFQNTRILIEDIAAQEMKALIDAAIPVLWTTGSREAALALCR